MAGLSSNTDSPSFSKMDRSSSFASRSVQQTSEIILPYLNLEPVPLLSEQQKYSRSGELRRAMGVGLEDQCKMPVFDELKRFKTGLADSASRARERLKFFQEAITNMDKYKTIVSKRRQRNEMSSEKSGGPTFSKLNGAQAHQGPSGSEISGPKSLVPNKRARSSLAESRSEGRGGVNMRQASVNNNNNNNTEKQRNSFEKDKNAPSGPGASEEKPPRGLAPGGDGWKTKLKRKRSVGSMVNRASDTEPKPSTQQRSNSSNNTETRAARFNDNGLPLRSELGSGNKTDGNSQQSSGPRASVKAVDKDRASSALDKDRPPPKGNKLGSRGDEPQSSSGTGNPKAKASRAPRSNSFVVMNSSPNFGRFPNSDAWDPPGKSASSAGPNRKRAAGPPGPPGPPSPPVTQWVGQRPLKIQRTRRAHVVSPVSNFESEGPANEASPPVSQQRGGGSSRSEASPVTGLSESEESKGKGAENEPAENIISNNNNNNNNGGNNNNGNNNKIMSLTGKKNSRVLLKEELGDGGVRRQGRTGRGGTSQNRSLLSVPKEKMEATETVPKPPKSGRPASSDKNDGRIGRPPLKKAVDRKSHGRPAQNFQTGSLDTGEQEDDKEELMAAINAARSSTYDASSGSFWKKMEPVFSLPTSDDFSFLKNQIAFAQELDKSACDILAPGYNEDKRAIDQPTKSDELATDDWLSQSAPLSQLLLSAFVSADDLLSVSNPKTENGTDHHFNVETGPFCNGFGSVDAFLEGNSGLTHRQNGAHRQSELYECRFEEMSFDDRILLELHSIGIYPDAPELDEGEGEIDKAILDLQSQLTDQVKEKKSHLQKLEKYIQDTKVNEERNLEQTAMNRLVERACKKLSKQGGRGGSGHKNAAGNKITKQLAQAFAKRTLARCHKFEQSGRSCFADSSLKDALFAPISRPDSKQPDGGSEKGRKLERGPSDLQRGPEMQKERGKKREVLLDEVSRGASTSSFGPKWKKSDQSKDSTKNSNAKGGARGERKNKAKPKQQKLAHLSAPQAAAPPAQPKREEKPSGSAGQTKDGNEGIFTDLPLNLDDLDVTGEGQDLGSWLNVDDEALQDNDLVGLQIPMDDLADLTFT